MNVEQLRKLGYKVRVKHYRRYSNIVPISETDEAGTLQFARNLNLLDSFLKKYFRVNHLDNLKKKDLEENTTLVATSTLKKMKENGVFEVKYLSCFGGKTVVEITTPEGEQLIGEAECSIKDQFNRKRGLQVAIGRCFYNSEEN